MNTTEQHSRRTAARNEARGRQCRGVGTANAASTACTHGVDVLAGDRAPRDQHSGPQRADQHVDQQFLVDRRVELAARDRSGQHPPVGLPAGVQDGVEQVGDLRMVPGLAQQAGHELATAAGEGVHGSVQQRRQVAVERAGIRDVDALQRQPLHPCGGDRSL
jgi:hypothetical protein